MNRQNGLKSFGSDVEVDVGVVRRELRIYRPNGALSMVYITAFESDATAIAAAENITRYGYQVDVLRDGTIIVQVSELNVVDMYEH